MRYKKKFVKRGGYKGKSSHRKGRGRGRGKRLGSYSMSRGGIRL